MWIVLGSLNSLRILYVSLCENLERVLCRCNNGDGEGMYCYKSNPARGCMSELVTVKLNGVLNLEDIPFMRHCWNLQWFEMSDDYPDNIGGCAVFPAMNGGHESGDPIDFRYLKKLHTFSLIGGEDMLGYECDAFIRWLLDALQLKDLIAFEYRSGVEEEVGGYTIDLNEVAELSPRLSVLSLRLPGEIEEVRGLQLLSELTILNLDFSKGLLCLPDLWRVPKLRWMCVHGCCKLECDLCLKPGAQGISAR